MLRHLQEAVAGSGMRHIDIAARLNKPKAYLSKVLNGQQVLTLIEIRNICRAAGVPFNEWVVELDRILDGVDAPYSDESESSASGASCT